MKPELSQAVLNRWLQAMIFTLCLIMGILEILYQISDSRYVRSVARQIVQQSGAADQKSQVLALRDFLRRTVQYQNAEIEGRPFLRDSAADTIRSGKGYCGEVTRAFINLAAAVGIRAQRINLWGRSPHVVAEAEIAPDKRVIVDCQNPPQIADLETLDQVILRPEYDDYYTLNLRRLHVNWLITRIRLQMGPLTYWTENPHALKALLWFLLAAALLAAKGLRILVRAELKRRGWIHVSDVQAVQESVRVYGRV